MEILSVNKKKNIGGDKKMKTEIHTRKGKKRDGYNERLS